MSVSIQAFAVAEQAIPVKAVYQNLSEHSAETEKIGMITQVQWSDGTQTEGIKHCCCAYLVEDEGHHILVDTGIGDLQRITKAREKHGDRFYLKEVKPLSQCLATVDLQPEDIDIVINTHLHWDHCGGNEMFPNASFYMPDSDISMALKAPCWASHFYPEMRSCVTSVADRMVLISDSMQITKHVRVIHLGGHTPGSQCVLVETEDQGIVALPGDVICKYENLENNWIGPAGNFWNITELVRAYDLLHEVSDVIVPSHDWRIFDRFPNGVIAQK